VTAAVRKLRGQPVPKEITLPVVIVTKDNVKSFMKTPEDRDPPDWNKFTSG